MSPRRSFGSPCNAACACPSGTTTRHAACAVKSWTIGPTTPSAVAVAATGSSATTPFATSFARRSPNSPRFHPNWSSPGSSPERPRTRVVLTLSSILASTPLPQLAVGADPRTSGSPGVCRGSGFLVSSLLRTSHTPQPHRRLLMSFTRWKLANAPSRTPRPRCHLLPARLGGARGRVVPGLAGSGCLDRLQVPRLAWRLRGHARDTSLRIAQRISCTLHRENARGEWLYWAGWRPG